MGRWNTVPGLNPKDSSRHPFSPLSRPTQFPKAAFSLSPCFLLLTCLTTTTLLKRAQDPCLPAWDGPITKQEGIFSPDNLFASPSAGRGGHLHWESCPGCKALQHRAGVGSPRQKGPGTHPSAGQFEPPQGVWPDVACFHQFPWAPRHLYGSNALGSCSHSH